MQAKAQGGAFFVSAWWESASLNPVLRAERGLP